WIFGIPRSRGATFIYTYPKASFRFVRIRGLGGSCGSPLYKGCGTGEIPRLHAARMRAAATEYQRSKMHAAAGTNDEDVMFAGYLSGNDAGGIPWRDHPDR